MKIAKQKKKKRRRRKKKKKTNGKTKEKLLWICCSTKFVFALTVIDVRCTVAYNSMQYTSIQLEQTQLYSLCSLFTLKCNRNLETWIVFLLFDKRLVIQNTGTHTHKSKSTCRTFGASFVVHLNMEYSIQSNDSYNGFNKQEQVHLLTFS